MSLDFETLRNTNLRRCGGAFHPLHSWSPTDWATAVAGELGEVGTELLRLLNFCNNVKKLRRQREGDPTPQALLDTLGEEAADVVIYLDLFTARLGINLGEAVRAKFNKVSEKVGSTDRL